MEVVDKITDIHANDEVEKAIFQAALSANTSVLSRLQDRLLDQTYSLIRHVQSRARIAFAPLKGFNYLEDVNASKAPAQVFSVAVERLRWKAERYKLPRLVKFRYLPLLWTPNDATDASRLRSLCGADVLVWGTYLTQNPNRIWLNIQHKSVTSKEDQTRDTPKLPTLFPYLLDLQSVIVIDQREMTNSYVVPVLALIHTLQSRGDASARKEAMQGWKPEAASLRQLGMFVVRLLRQIKLLDQLQFSVSEVDKLIEALVLDIFLALPEFATVKDDDMYPSAERILVDIAGEWVGAEIRRTESYRSEGLPGRLKPIIERCITMDPGKPENYYRLGALECIANRPDEAIATFGKVRGLDEVNTASRSYAHAMASIALAESEVDTTNGVLAQCAAACGRAINLGSDDAKKSLRKEVEKSIMLETLRSSGELSVPTSMKVIDRLINAEY
jgi:hypothetical protein